jgi:hypothetical protein
MEALAGGLLDMMIDLHGERLAIRALLEAHSDWSAKRAKFRRAMRRRIAQMLTLRCPKLSPEIARDMAVILLQNMKTAGVLSRELRGSALSSAVAELRHMTQLYLTDKLSD